MNWRLRFYTGMTPAKEPCNDNQDQAACNKDFFTIEPIDRATIEIRIREQTMEEDCERSNVNAKMEGFPKPAAESNPEVRGNDDDGDQIKCNCADCIFDGFARRVHRINKVCKLESWVLVEEQKQRMNCRR